jgi:hypothetical protein
LKKQIKKIMKTKLLIIAMFLSVAAYANDGEKKILSKIEPCTKTATSTAWAQKTCDDGTIIMVYFYATETVTDENCELAEELAIITSSLKANAKRDQALPGIDYLC